MTRRFRYKGKNIEVLECKTFFSKFRGLMFRKNSKPLLFSFEEPTRQSIHSLFCRPFLAVWFLKRKVVEKRVIRPFSIIIRPKEKFDRLLEIPLE